MSYLTSIDTTENISFLNYTLTSKDVFSQLSAQRPGELIEEEYQETVESVAVILRSSNTMVDLKKLGDTNYAVWKFRMELVLIQEDLLSVVTEQKPENPPAVWIVKDAKARALIGLSVEDGQLSHVIRATSSKEMWDTL